MLRVCAYQIFLLSAILFLLHKCNCQVINYNKICNVGNCHSCVNFDNVCYYCNQGYKYKLNADGKYECSPFKCNLPHCKYCSDQQTCFECEQGYYARDLKCEPNICNNDPGCSRCSYDNVCTHCRSGFQNSYQYQTCGMMSIPNCKFFSYTYSEVDCKSCYEGFYRQQNTGNCIAHGCNVDNCITCWGDNFCGDCSPGFDALNGTCIPCNIANCKNCSSSNVCLTCLSGFGFENNVCRAYICNITNCLQCRQRDNNCSKCVTGYYTNGNSSLCVAYVCNVSDCLICYRDNQCYKCKPRFSRFTYQCGLCNISNCYSCSSTNICNKCDFGYGLAANNTCRAYNCSHFPNCKLCYPSKSNNSIDMCFQCYPGYGLTKNVCKAYSCDNVINCKSCSANNVCGQCNTGFTLFNQACIPCNVNNCKICQNENVCGECKVGFKLFTAGCFICNISNCLSCSADNKCENCSPGFNLYTAGCFVCNIGNCSSCSANNTCERCNNKYLLENNVCRLQIVCDLDNCLSCSSDNVCEQCHNNFTASSGNSSCDCSIAKGFVSSDSLCSCPTKTTYNTNKCTACDLSNCILCLQDSKCNQCQPTYYLNTFANSSTICYLCNIQYCQICSAHSVCSQCSGSYKISTDASKCVICTVPDCKSCSQNNVCSQCNAGKNLIVLYSNTSCISCTVDFCQKCSANQICFLCSVGYTLVSGGCKICNYPCKTCSQTKKQICNKNCIQICTDTCTQVCTQICNKQTLKCLTCSFPFGLTPNQNGDCLSCDLSFCLKCDALNSTKCVTCQTGFTWNDSLGKCVFSCPAHCSACSQTTYSACSDGYRLDNNFCIKCKNAPKCKECSTDFAICSLCSARFYNSGSQCQPCADNCETCTGPDQCLTFKESSGQIAVVINGITQPAVCDPACKTCLPTKPSTCIVCNIGFSLSSNSVCVACDSKCKTCGSTPTACSSCYGNAFFSPPSTCLQCDVTSNCQTCLQTNKTECINCPNQYSFQNGICKKTKCSLNCITCISSKQCTICKQGYSLSSKKTCLPCLSNCRQCSGLSNAVCLDCGRNFYLSSTSVCVPCSKNCQSCTELGCTQCQRGYFVDSTFNCSVVCSYPCATCDSVNSTTCKSCLAGYSFDTSTKKCKQVLACTDGCLTCPFSYFMNGSECIACSVQNCARCSTAPSCILCKDGYFMASSTTCTKCPNGISRCLNENFALSCSPGFTSFSTNNFLGSLKCVKCTSPCKTCTNHPEQCDQCSDGYYLQGWKCVTNFHFKFDIVIAAINSDFYLKYSEFLTTLANFIGGDINSITIKNIGSATLSSSQLLNKLASSQTTSVTGIATVTAPPNSSSSTQQFNNLQSGLTPGNYIAGMQIISSTAAMNGGQVKKQQEKESSELNVTLIIAITVSIGVFALLIMGFFVYRKYHKDETSIHVQEMNDLPSSDVVLGYYVK